jgi:O-acetyl-ADP-ribose deacetylase (regulator of RNase III)
LSIFKIGTGTIGLDANKVCEAMISAASECLHQYKMDVIFVIYQSSGSEHSGEPYQVNQFD